MLTSRNNGAAPAVRLSGLLLFLFILAAAPAAWSQQHPSAPAPAAPSSTCIDCHSSLDAPLKVTAEQHMSDIHGQKGLGCNDCHGGDPTSADNAMDPKKGFIGKPKRADIPKLCARCHSDGAYMRKYNPSLRTDQLAQYKTSIHGQRLAKGDTNVAVCTDCHGVHGIKPASDAQSKVNPLNVVSTCGACHADPAHMKPYGIPTDQVAGYNASVHHDALAVRGDLSAPTCVTCHGNHGAAPPGVSSVENVCSNCHVFQAQLFDGSPHKAAFAAAGMPGCVTCHSNHKIKHPDDAMLGSGSQSVCTNCHTGGDAGLQQAIAMHKDLSDLDSAIAKADALIDHAERSGMEVSQAKLSQTEARAALTKARVSIHSFSAAGIKADVQQGNKLAAADLAAGEQAMAERDYRRRGLGIAVLLILLTIGGLWLF
ncbi:MAG TPA: cytochrome c3 family protein, partial [Terriglobales bacterium]|nr:cytochrome c3 family protein [Terriglobales bacterium]